MVHEIALTIKPTMKCNMRCRHCFNGDSLNASNMLDINTVYNFIEAACREYKDVKVTFHGGEPTLAGVEFYEKAFEFESQMVEKYGVKFSNNFTTNGLLLNDELIDLLIKNNTLINISFDGPYNDILRGHSEQVFERIGTVKNKGGRVRVFCTIAKGSFEHLQKTYDWFNEKEIDFKVLPIEPRGYAAIDQQFLMETDSFIQKLTDVYRYWLKDKECKIRLYTFEEFASLRRTTQFKPFWFRREIALNPDGKIYPFGRPNDIQFCLGVPNDSLSLKACFASEEYKRMLDILNRCREKYCTKCLAAKVCNGVCICMSYMYVQEKKLLEYSCNQSRRIFERILAINDQVQKDFDNNKSYIYNNTVKEKFKKDNGKSY